MISVEFNGGRVPESFVLVEFLKERFLEISDASPRVSAKLMSRVQRTSSQIVDRWQQGAGMGIVPDLVDISDLKQELKSLFATYVCQQKLQ